MFLLKPSFILTLFCMLTYLSCNSKTFQKSTSPSKPPYRPYESYSQDAWYKIYSQNKLDSAQVLLEKHLQTNPKELPTLAFYAELLKRVKEYKKADSIAGVVLSLDSSNGCAYQVMGDLRNPQYGKNELVKSDSSNCMKYYYKGIEKDPTNGNLWEIVIFEALKTGDIDLYKHGLMQFYNHYHFTQTALSYAKILLRDLPPNAILFTNGDMDTYPLLTLQEGEKYRQDVIIMNLSLLNLKWYFKAMCKFANIDYNASEVNIDSIEHFQDSNRKFILKSTQFFRVLSQLQNDKIHNRPLCLSFTVPVKKTLPYKKSQNKLIYKGYYILYDQNTKTPYIDYDVYTTLIDSINPEDFIEPLISKYENSPLLLNSNTDRKVDLNIIAPTLQYISNELSKKNVNVAEKQLAKVKNYLNIVGNNSEKPQKFIDQLDTRIEELKN